MTWPETPKLLYGSQPLVPGKCPPSPGNPLATQPNIEAALSEHKTGENHPNSSLRTLVVDMSRQHPETCIIKMRATVCMLDIEGKQQRAMTRLQCPYRNERFKA